MATYAYYELNIDYIIETYCVNVDKPELKCNGKCHLTSQLSLADSNLEDDTKSTVQFKEAFYPVYFQENTQYALFSICNYNNLKILDFYTNFYTSSLVFKTIKPQIS